MSKNVTELPKYKSHKIVHAIKIHYIDYKDKPGEDMSAILYPKDEQEDKKYGGINVPPEFVWKHLRVIEKEPEIENAKDVINLLPDTTEGYYVTYKDGYKSWSPVEAFEAGYTLLNNMPIIESVQIEALAIEKGDVLLIKSDDYFSRAETTTFKKAIENEFMKYKGFVPGIMIMNKDTEIKLMNQEELKRMKKLVDNFIK